MGWFDEQIKQRKLNDERLFSDSFSRIADAVTGECRTEDSYHQSMDAVCEILRFYGFRSVGDIPESVTDFNQQLEYLCRPCGIMRRSVHLPSGWYRDAVGAMLGFRSDTGAAVALLPDIHGYRFMNNGKYERITEKNAGIIGSEALCFYRPFPLKKLTPLDLIGFALKTRSLKDTAVIILIVVLSTLLGLFIPKLTYFLYNDVVNIGSVRLLISSVIMLISVKVSTVLFGLYKSMYNTLFMSRTNIEVEAAGIMRILSMPASFFRNYSSGELTVRVSCLNSMSGSLMDLIFTTGFTSLFSLAYIGSIFRYAPALVLPSILVLLLTVAFSAVSTLVQTRISRKNMKLNSRLSGIAYAMVSGIQKIRLSGSEKRAFSRWADLYAQTVKNTYRAPLFLRANTAIATGISLVGTLIMYYYAVNTGVSLAEYSAFNSAYGMVSGAFMSLASIMLSLSTLRPDMDMARPIMDTVPEISENRRIVTALKGGIEFNNVSFRYNDSMPLVVDNLSLKIKRGEYIAVVGKTGCGKSTLVRLLLGFDKPQKGSIYYDGIDLNSLDLRSLRSKTGVVLQDGKLFCGTIRTNIALSAPWLSTEEIWEAADIAGIGDDIRAMPMGLNTVISEGSGGMSGGQRQRLLIARAISHKPEILIFDEATSALDNITQRKVSDAIGRLNCTRIVIAHRLSTIRDCDRILYLEDGKIREEGSYDELIAKDGLFAELVRRQRLDTEV